ncbi:UNVERIFIED_CONTAM: hypothetical protein HDU68_003566 [Siphonaria sp. JEL0065]|nr:hypothetical protein HDU68_003566 [Siphonaria sp. JEL0065]
MDSETPPLDSRSNVSNLQRLFDARKERLRKLSLRNNSLQEKVDSAASNVTLATATPTVAEQHSEPENIVHQHDQEQQEHEQEPQQRLLQWSLSTPFPETKHLIPQRSVSTTSSDADHPGNLHSHSLSEALSYSYSESPPTSSYPRLNKKSSVQQWPKVSDLIKRHEVKETNEVKRAPSPTLLKQPGRTSSIKSIFNKEDEVLPLPKATSTPPQQAASPNTSRQIRSVLRHNWSSPIPEKSLSPTNSLDNSSFFDSSKGHDSSYALSPTDPAPSTFFSSDVSHIPRSASPEMRRSKSLPAGFMPTSPPLSPISHHETSSTSYSSASNVLLYRDIPSDIPTSVQLLRDRFDTPQTTTSHPKSDYLSSTPPPPRQLTASSAFFASPNHSGSHSSSAAAVSNENLEYSEDEDGLLPKEYYRQQFGGVVGELSFHLKVREDQRRRGNLGNVGVVDDDDAEESDDDVDGDHEGKRRRKKFDRVRKGEGGIVSVKEILRNSAIVAQMSLPPLALPATTNTKMDSKMDSSLHQGDESERRIDEVSHGEDANQPLKASNVETTTAITGTTASSTVMAVSSTNEEEKVESNASTTTELVSPPTTTFTLQDSKPVDVANQVNILHTQKTVATTTVKPTSSAHHPAPVDVTHLSFSSLINEYGPSFLRRKQHHHQLSTAVSESVKEDIPVVEETSVFPVLEESVIVEVLSESVPRATTETSVIQETIEGVGTKLNPVEVEEKSHYDSVVAECLEVPRSDVVVSQIEDAQVEAREVVEELIIPTNNEPISHGQSTKSVAERQTTVYQHITVVPTTATTDIATAEAALSVFDSDIQKGGMEVAFSAGLEEISGTSSDFASMRETEMNGINAVVGDSILLTGQVDEGKVSTEGLILDGESLKVVAVAEDKLQALSERDLYFIPEELSVEVRAMEQESQIVETVSKKEEDGGDGVQTIVETQRMVSPSFVSVVTKTTRIRPVVGLSSFVGGVESFGGVVEARKFDVDILEDAIVEGVFAMEDEPEPASEVVIEERVGAYPQSDSASSANHRDGQSTAGITTTTITTMATAATSSSNSSKSFGDYSSTTDIDKDLSVVWDQSSIVPASEFPVGTLPLVSNDLDSLGLPQAPMPPILESNPLLTQNAWAIPSRENSGWDSLKSSSVTPFLPPPPPGPPPASLRIVVPIDSSTPTLEDEFAGLKSPSVEVEAVTLSELEAQDDRYKRLSQIWNQQHAAIPATETDHVPKEAVAVEPVAADLDVSHVELKIAEASLDPTVTVEKNSPLANASSMKSIFQRLFGAAAVKPKSAAVVEESKSLLAEEEDASKVTGVAAVLPRTSRVFVQEEEHTVESTVETEVVAECPVEPVVEPNGIESVNVESSSIARFDEIPVNDAWRSSKTLVDEGAAAWSSEPSISMSLSQTTITSTVAATTSTSGTPMHENGDGFEKQQVPALRTSVKSMFQSIFAPSKYSQASQEEDDDEGEEERDFYAHTGYTQLSNESDDEVVDKLVKHQESIQETHSVHVVESNLDEFDVQEPSIPPDAVVSAIAVETVEVEQPSSEVAIQLSGIPIAEKTLLTEVRGNPIPDTIDFYDSDNDSQNNPVELDPEFDWTLQTPVPDPIINHNSIGDEIFQKIKSRPIRSRRSMQQLKQVLNLIDNAIEDQGGSVDSESVGMSDGWSVRSMPSKSSMDSVQLGAISEHEHEGEGILGIDGEVFQKGVDLWTGKSVQDSDTVSTVTTIATTTTSTAVNVEGVFGSEQNIWSDSVTQDTYVSPKIASSKMRKFSFLQQHMGSAADVEVVKSIEQVPVSPADFPFSTLPASVADSEAFLEVTEVLSVDSVAPKMNSPAAQLPRFEDGFGIPTIPSEADTFQNDIGARETVTLSASFDACESMKEVNASTDDSIDTAPDDIEHSHIHIELLETITTPVSSSNEDAEMLSTLSNRESKERVVTPMAIPHKTVGRPSLFSVFSSWTHPHDHVKETVVVESEHHHTVVDDVIHSADVAVHNIASSLSHMMDNMLSSHSVDSTSENATHQTQDVKALDAVSSNTALTATSVVEVVQANGLMTESTGLRSESIESNIVAEAIAIEDTATSIAIDPVYLTTTENVDVAFVHEHIQEPALYQPRHESTITSTTISSISASGNPSKDEIMEPISIGQESFAISDNLPVPIVEKETVYSPPSFDLSSFLAKKRVSLVPRPNSIVDDSPTVHSSNTIVTTTEVTTITPEMTSSFDIPPEVDDVAPVGDIRARYSISVNTAENQLLIEPQTSSNQAPVETPRFSFSSFLDSRKRQPHFSDTVVVSDALSVHNSVDVVGSEEEHLESTESIPVVAVESVEPIELVKTFATVETVDVVDSIVRIMDTRDIVETVQTTEVVGAVESIVELVDSTWAADASINQATESVQDVEAVAVAKSVAHGENVDFTPLALSSEAASTAKLDSSTVAITTNARPSFSFSAFLNSRKLSPPLSKSLLVVDSETTKVSPSLPSIDIPVTTEPVDPIVNVDPTVTGKTSTEVDSILEGIPIEHSEAKKSEDHHSLLFLSSRQDLPPKLSDSKLVIANGLEASDEPDILNAHSPHAKHLDEPLGELKETALHVLEDVETAVMSTLHAMWGAVHGPETNSADLQSVSTTTITTQTLMEVSSVEHEVSVSEKTVPLTSSSGDKAPLNEIVSETLAVEDCTLKPSETAPLVTAPFVTDIAPLQPGVVDFLSEEITELPPTNVAETCDPIAGAIPTSENGANESSKDLVIDSGLISSRSPSELSDVTVRESRVDAPSIPRTAESPRKISSLISKFEAIPNSSIAEEAPRVLPRRSNFKLSFLNPPEALIAPSVVDAPNAHTLLDSTPLLSSTTAITNAVDKPDSNSLPSKFSFLKQSSVETKDDLSTTALSSSSISTTVTTITSASTFVTPSTSALSDVDMSVPIQPRAPEGGPSEVKESPRAEDPLHSIHESVPETDTKVLPGVENLNAPKNMFSFLWGQTTKADADRTIDSVPEHAVSPLAALTDHIVEPVVENEAEPEKTTTIVTTSLKELNYEPTVDFVVDAAKTITSDFPTDTHRNSLKFSFLNSSDEKECKVENTPNTVSQPSASTVKEIQALMDVSIVHPVDQVSEEYAVASTSTTIVTTTTTENTPDAQSSTATQELHRTSLKFSFLKPPSDTDLTVSSVTPEAAIASEQPTVPPSVVDAIAEAEVHTAIPAIGREDNALGQCHLPTMKFSFLDSAPATPASLHDALGSTSSTEKALVDETTTVQSTLNGYKEDVFVESVGKQVDQEEVVEKDHVLAMTVGEEVVKAVDAAQPSKGLFSFLWGAQQTKSEPVQQQQQPDLLKSVQEDAADSTKVSATITTTTTVTTTTKEVNTVDDGKTRAFSVPVSNVSSREGCDQSAKDTAENLESQSPSMFQRLFGVGDSTITKAGTETCTSTVTTNAKDVVATVDIVSINDETYTVIDSPNTILRRKVSFAEIVSVRDSSTDEIEIQKLKPEDASEAVAITVAAELKTDPDDGFLDVIRAVMILLFIFYVLYQTLGVIFRPLLELLWEYFDPMWIGNMFLPLTFFNIEKQMNLRDIPSELHARILLWMDVTPSLFELVFLCKGVFGPWLLNEEAFALNHVRLSLMRDKFSLKRRRSGGKAFTADDWARVPATYQAPLFVRLVALREGNLFDYCVVDRVAARAVELCDDAKRNVAWLLFGARNGKEKTVEAWLKTSSCLLETDAALVEEAVAAAVEGSSVAVCQLLFHFDFSIESLLGRRPVFHSDTVALALTKHVVDSA